MGPRFNGVEDKPGGVAVISTEFASMGPRFNGVEDLLYGPRREVAGRASMGPRFNGVEDRTNRTVMIWMNRCFNGATL